MATYYEFNPEQQKKEASFRPSFFVPSVPEDGYKGRREYSMRSIFLILLFQSPWGVLVAGQTPEKVYFISTEGDDRYSGTLPQPNANRTDGPFASLTAARDAIRRLKGESGNRPVRVKIRGGKYFLDETVVFRSADGGNREAPISYEAHQDERPVLSGGIRLTGWKKTKGSIFQAPIPAAIRGQGHAISQLYFKNRRQILARQW